MFLFNVLFNRCVSLKAPYFLNLRALVNELRPGYTSVSVNQRWALQNHIKTVHAIAVCNLVEMTMGLTAEASIPAHLRWLPKGMDVRYLKKATGKLTATCNIDENTFFILEKYPGDVKMPVEVRNAEGVLVTTADVLWYSCYFVLMFFIDSFVHQ